MCARQECRGGILPNVRRGDPHGQSKARWDGGIRRARCERPCCYRDNCRYADGDEWCRRHLSDLYDYHHRDGVTMDIKRFAVEETGTIELRGADDSPLIGDDGQPMTATVYSPGTNHYA